KAWLIAGGVVVAAVARWDIFVAILVAWFWAIAYLAIWNVRRRRYAREEIQAALRQAGYEVVKMNYLYWRTGAVSIVDTSRLQFVVRVLVRQAGQEQTVWARWGRPWFFDSDRLDLNWNTR